MVAIASILPDSYGYWKNMAKLTNAKRNNGMKIEAIAFPGYAYRGIIKWQYW